MATITSTGVGSGLDINSLVSQLVAAERATPDNRITRDDARLTTEFTALASLKGALSALQGNVNGLKSGTGLNPRTATVSDDDSFTASATADAAPGIYDVQITTLATASRLGSDVYSGGPDSVAGTGTLTINVGSKSFSIAITSENDTLAQVRDAINNASDNAGVRATLIRDSAGTGSYLVLSGSATGVANAVSVSASNADSGLTQLVQGLQSADVDHDVVAQDAVVFVSGYEIHSATNTVTGAIDGVTLNLKQAEVGKTSTLTVARDTAATQSRVQSFVTAFNLLAQQVSVLSKYDASTQTAGPLLGDAMLRGIDSQVRRMISDPVPGATGNYTSLASIGITTTATGTLQLDSAKFNAAMTADPQAVNRLFSSDNGVAARLGTFLDTQLSSTSALASRNASITTKQRDLVKQKDALEARMLVIQQRYMKQFTALDSMLAQMQSTSSYLSQQMQGLSNLNSK